MSRWRIRQPDGEFARYGRDGYILEFDTEEEAQYVCEYMENDYGEKGNVPEKVKEYVHFTTFVKTQDGTIYDIGNGYYPPTHFHGRDGRGKCPEGFVVDAWAGKDPIYYRNKVEE